MANGAATSGGAQGDQSPLAVTWDSRLKQPRTFVWRRRRYRIERIVQTWIIETGWWQEDIRVNRHYWRVLAEGRTFDLFYDRRAKLWRLERALN
jgi:hypothetical protein